MKYLFLFFCLMPTTLFAQSVHINEVKYIPHKGDKICLPVIVSGNHMADSLVNNVIRLKILDAEDVRIPVKKAIRDRVESGLTGASYEVTYNKNGILSLAFSLEGMGAYPSYWCVYLNFDSKTGKQLKIGDIIKADRVTKFKAKVLADKVFSLKRYKKEIKGYEDSDWAIETVNSCMKSLNTDNFSITQVEIEIIDECDFPHAIQNMAPVYSLKYSYHSLATFLRPAFLTKLTAPLAKERLVASKQ